MMEPTLLDADSVAITEGTASSCPTAMTRLLACGETILFVEDETFVREVTAEVLRAAGYRVLPAPDAAAAALAYDFEHVDMLLSDVVLPGESGHTLARRLKRARPKLKVLLMTGYAEQMIRQKACMSECLPKPFSVEMLLKKVRQTLDRGEETECTPI
jgi:two-component system, cell cycle sensor histidine kinase and response regulator CckA